MLGSALQAPLRIIYKYCHNFDKQSYTAQMICARTKAQKTHCENTKFMNTLKLHNWFNSYSDFEGFSVLCLVVEFYRGGSAAKGATLFRSLIQKPT